MSHLIIGSAPGVQIPDRSYDSVTFINGSIYYRKLFPFLNDYYTYHFVAIKQRLISILSNVHVDRCISFGGNLPNSYTCDNLQHITNSQRLQTIEKVTGKRYEKPSNGVFACVYHIDKGNTPIMIVGISAYDGVGLDSHIHDKGFKYTDEHKTVDENILKDIFKNKDSALSSE